MAARMAILPVQSIMQDNPAHQRAEHEALYENGAAYVIDHYCALEQAAVSVTDCGFAHADAAYDVTTATRGYIFRLDEHLQRYQQSLAKFRLENPFSLAATRDILINLVRNSGYRDAFIWWCATRGDFPAGLQKIDPANYQPRFYAYVMPFRFYADDALRQKGVDIMIARSRWRIPDTSVDPTAKNFHWMDMKLTLFEAFDAGYEWSVLTDAEGLLTEAPGSNIFLVNGNRLLTPAKGCLEGITRQSTLDIATEMGLETCVGAVHADELFAADEAFLTSSAGGIAPINSVDGKILGGQPGPGPRTVEIHNAYWRKRWNGWNGTRVDYGIGPD